MPNFDFKMLQQLAGIFAAVITALGLLFAYFNGGSSTSAAPDKSSIGSSRGTGGGTTEVDQTDNRIYIYRNSLDFAHLTNADYIAPGAQYNLEQSSCSVGWLAEDQVKDIYFITAGHCGNEGDPVYLGSDHNREHPIGRFVYSVDEFDTTGYDLAVVKLDDPETLDIRNKPDITVTVEDIAMAEVQGAQWLSDNKPMVCNIGWRSGLSCGPFMHIESNGTIRYNSISDSGDSGGAVFALNVKAKEITPVGVLNGGSHTDATQSIAYPIESLLGAGLKYNLTVLK